MYKYMIIDEMMVIKQVTHSSETQAAHGYPVVPISQAASQRVEKVDQEFLEQGHNLAPRLVIPNSISWVSYHKGHEKIPAQDSSSSFRLDMKGPSQL